MVLPFIKLLKFKAKITKYLAKYFPFLAKSANLPPPVFRLSEAQITYKEIYFLHDENISDKWTNYFDIYDDYFRRYIGMSADALEIGIQNGGNLQILNKYLKNATIYGVDIDPNINNLQLADNITVFNFNITDKQSIKDYLKELQFDIIIDDGSHICSDIITTFKLLFSKVKPGGVFLIEDLHTSYWKSHGGSYLGKDSAIEFFKKFADLLNLYHINDIQFEKNISNSDLYIFQWLGSVSFHDSVVVIRKLLTPRFNPYKRVMVGKLEPVAPMLELAKKEGWYHNNTN